MSAWTHVYDLAQVVTPERMVAALCSVISNWRCDYLLSKTAFMDMRRSRIIKKMLPAIKIIDVIHSVDEAWDQIGGHR